MNIIQLINRQREVVGQIAWNAPDDFQVTIEAGLAAGINAFLTEAREKGLMLRSGEKVEHDGKIRFVDRSERITVNDKRFLRALVDKGTATIRAKLFVESFYFKKIKLLPGQFSPHGQESS